MKDDQMTEWLTGDLLYKKINPVATEEKVSEWLKHVWVRHDYVLGLGWH